MKYTKIEEANGANLQGYLNADYRELVEVFGEPIRYEADGTSHLNNKIDAEWRLKFQDGTIATIYNYKNGVNYMGAEGLRLMEIQKWNVGGNSERAVERVKTEVIDWQHRLHDTGKSTNNWVTALKLAFPN